MSDKDNVVVSHSSPGGKRVAIKPFISLDSVDDYNDGDNINIVIIIIVFVIIIIIIFVIII